MQKISNSISLKEMSEALDKDYFSGNRVVNKVKFLSGKVLTVIDASYPDSDQKKAVKDLIRNLFADEMSDITKEVSDYKILEVTPGDLKESREISLEEIIP